MSHRYGRPKDQAARSSGNWLLHRAGFAVVGSAVGVVDVYLIWLTRDQEGTDLRDPGRLFFVAFVGACALLLFAAMLTRREATIQLASAATSALFWAGAPTIFSIGYLLLIMAIAAFVLLLAVIGNEPPPARVPTRHRVGRVVALTVPLIVLTFGMSLP